MEWKVVLHWTTRVHQIGCPRQGRGSKASSGLPSARLARRLAEYIVHATQPEQKKTCKDTHHTWARLVAAHPGCHSHRLQLAQTSQNKCRALKNAGGPRPPQNCRVSHNPSACQAPFHRRPCHLMIVAPRFHQSPAPCRTPHPMLSLSIQAGGCRRPSPHAGCRPTRVSGTTATTETRTPSAC